MPKSETWPSETRQATRSGMESAGSCDSVVSANSRFSDDSLEHLSAEEKACLMFLEETIDALDDSGLSNDEPDQLPGPGNLATKLADLSASMSKSKLGGSQIPASKVPVKQNVHGKLAQNYLVPTPLVMAGGSLCSDRTKSQFRKDKPERDRKSNPPSKAVDSRGPLSYDALVHLRRSASTKKTPLCPTVDHTIELNKHRRFSVENPNRGHLTKSDKSHSDFPKTSPPPVAPKPKKVPPNILLTNPNVEAVTADVKQAGDPKAVRLEALHKLGLLRELETLSLAPTETHRNPSKKLLQSGGSFHHPSDADRRPIPGSHQPGLGRSVSLDHYASSENCPEQSASAGSANVVGYSVMVVPGMGADRKEALRKLGLLKD